MTQAEKDELLAMIGRARVAARAEALYISREEAIVATKLEEAEMWAERIRAGGLSGHDR